MKKLSKLALPVALTLLLGVNSCDLLPKDDGNEGSNYTEPLRNPNVGESPLGPINYTAGAECSGFACLNDVEYWHNLTKNWVTTQCITSHGSAENPPDLASDKYFERLFVLWGGRLGAHVVGAHPIDGAAGARLTAMNPGLSGGTVFPCTTYYNNIIASDDAAIYVKSLPGHGH